LTAPRILFVVAQRGFRDEELYVPREFLLRKGAEVRVAAPQAGAALGMLGAVLEPDLALPAARAEDYDALSVAGGRGSPEHLWENAALRALVREFAAAGKVTGFICLSGALAGLCGVARGKRATCWPDARAVAALRAGGAVHVEKGVVRDGTLVTASDPALAEAYGAELGRALGL
jgi:protease I